MTDPAITRLLDEIGTKSPSLHAIVETLRVLVRQHAPEAEAQIKYGGIHYSRTLPVYGIFAYKGHVSLEFSRGAEFDDGGLLGDGQHRRHLKFTDLSEIDSERVGRYIAEAYSRA
jgi:hypothetical protein